MRADPARLFLWSGLVWQGAMQAYWVTLVVRLTVELQLPSYQLVLLGTVMESALLLAEVPTGVLADTVSRKLSVVIGFVAVGIAQAASGLVDGFGLLVLTQAAWGIGYTFRSGADSAWVTDELGGAAQVEELILRRARLQMVVAVVAIVGGAVLGRLIGLSAAVVASGAVLLLTGVVLAVIMPETRERPVEQAGRSLRRSVGDLGATLSVGARVAWSSRSLRVLVTVLVTAGLASELIDRLDVRRLDQLGLSADYDEILLVGLIVAAQAAVGALLLWRAEARLRGAGAVTGLAAMLALSAVGIAVIGLVAVLPLAALAVVVQGGLATAARPLQVTWANAHAPASVRATVLSFAEQANSLGEIGGGIMLGALAAATTVPTAMAASAALMLSAAALALRGRQVWAPDLLALATSASGSSGTRPPPGTSTA